MKNSIIIGFLTIMAATSCKKDYILGGGHRENTMAYANMSTYDVLKSSPLYDTLVMLIDTAGLKDQINQANTTFFAPSDYSIYNYLQNRTINEQSANPYAQFGLDSLIYYIVNNINGTRDSLRMYLVAQSLPYSVLTASGTIYPTALPGDTVDVSYEFTKSSSLGYNSVSSTVPQVVYFTQIWHPSMVTPYTPADSIPISVGVRTLCTTSGMATRNGYMNALDNAHVLFFYGTKQ